MKLKDLLLGRKVLTNLDSVLKRRDITLPTKVRLVKVMVFSIVMYGCESWTINKAESQRVDTFELWCWRRLLSPLDCKEIQQVHSEGNKLWKFIGRTDAVAETPIIWPTDGKNWLTGKDPDAEKDWRQEGKGKTEDEMVGRHHHEFDQALGSGDGQRSLACCSPWGHKESDMTNGWTELFRENVGKETGTSFHSPPLKGIILCGSGTMSYLSFEPLSLVYCWQAKYIIFGQILLFNIKDI